MIANEKRTGSIDRVLHTLKVRLFNLCENGDLSNEKVRNQIEDLKHSINVLGMIAESIDNPPLPYKTIKDKFLGDWVWVQSEYFVGWGKVTMVYDGSIFFGSKCYSFDNSSFFKYRRM